MRLVTYLLTFVVLGLVGNVEAAIIAFTDFNGRTVSGATASNLSWTVSGVADPGDLTAAAPDGLFDTPDAQNLFAVNRNIFDEGIWTVDISLDVGSSLLLLDTVTLDAYIFNNSGSFQTANRDLDMMIELLQGGVIESDTINNIYPNNNIAPVQPQLVSFDLSGNTLAANTNYILRITASGNVQGNNAGFDNLSINGDVNVIPEPMSLAIWSMLGGIGFVACWSRRKRAARLSCL